MNVNRSLRQSQIFEAVFTYRKVGELEEFLNAHPKIDFMTITDSQNNTVLHQLAYQGHLDLIKIYIHETKKNIYRRIADQALEKNAFEQQFRQWLNRKNSEGFTPLLYAAYSGHLDVIRYLVEEHKIDFLAKTSNGLNGLHLAAQKNAVTPFLYFHGRISLQEVDDMRSTPLHWAAYMNSQEVVAYILSVCSLEAINLRDSEGNTPLMLATTYGNTRIVRRLLIKGANRYIRNEQKKLPIEIAQESEFRTITKMLSEDFSCCDFIKFYCNIKIEYKPKSRKFIIPTLFLIGFFLNAGIINFFIKFTEKYYLYTQALLFFSTLALYLSLLLPTPKQERRNFQQLLYEHNTEQKLKRVCFDCVNLVPKRGYHCDICRVCVKQYDHHCTWINNCVGKKNIGRFIWFLTSLLISLALIATVSITATISIVSDDSHRFEEQFTFRYQHHDSLQKICLICLFLVCEVTSIFFFPVLTLFIVQIRNLLTNKTTFQKARGPSQENQMRRKLRQTKVSLRNCRVMCTDFKGSFVSARSSFGQLLPSDKLSNDLLTADKYGSDAADLSNSLK